MSLNSALQTYPSGTGSTQGMSYTQARWPPCISVKLAEERGARGGGRGGFADREDSRLASELISLRYRRD